MLKLVDCLFKGIMMVKIEDYKGGKIVRCGYCGEEWEVGFGYIHLGLDMCLPEDIEDITDNWLQEHCRCTIPHDASTTARPDWPAWRDTSRCPVH